MTSKTLNLEGLKTFIHQQNPLGAKEFIENVVNFFDRPLTKAELDVAFEKLFSKESGSIAFLKSSIRANKLFQESNVNILTLWHNLLTKHGSNMDFSMFAPDIIQSCMMFIASNIAPSAKERERATIVVQILVQKKFVEDDLVAETLDRVLNVFNLKKQTELFAYQVFKLLGIIVRCYPEIVSENQAHRIKVECFKTLDGVMITQQEVRFRTLAGSVECLEDYLMNFAPSPETDPDTCNSIYTSTRKLSNLSNDIKYKSVFRAALSLFTNHSTLFTKQIYRDFKYWHECLSKWLSSPVHDDRRAGCLASYAFHKVIAEESKSDEENSKEKLEFLLNEFRKTLESIDSRNCETRIAIRGFGTMSQLCKRHVPTILEDMIGLVVQRCDLILLADDSAMRDLLDHFPDYIHALSTVVKEVQDPQISDVMVENLKNIMIRLIRDFHYLPTCHCSYVANSMCNAFYSIYLTDVTLLERLLSKVIFEGVVWTCSHKHIFDANADWAENIDWKNNITFKSYSILWHALLDEETEVRSFDKSTIVDRIFDQLMLTLYRILDKLDLRTEKRIYTGEDGKNQEFHFCDPNFDLCPIRPKDFHIFINLVDFYRDLWSKFHRPHTLNWIEGFCERMVKFALRNPLVSGFLKLLEVGLSTAVYLKIFDRKLSPQLDSLLSHALRVMIVNCQRVSGELQISTIELVLQYPVVFYKKCLNDMIPVLEIALDLGKSMSCLANLAINCLEKLSDQSDDEDLQDLYRKVLPLLDSYLMGHCSVEYLSIREGHSGNKLQKPNKAKKNHSGVHGIQAHIVSLLGKLHPDAATLLVMNSAKADNLVKWDSQKYIRLNLKLPEISPVLYLDTLVPRICHLAMTSTDRHIKIAACEVVHSLVLYLIGARVHHGQTWMELCKRMLILGCDGDATVQQMFEPLLMQVMHFMSKYENLDRGVEEIMDTLMNGICSKSNFGLRDLSASCLREFVEWSIKQTTPQQLAASPVSIEIILGRLRIYSLDSDASKRVGAALAFNNLYRRLREEETICDVFFVDLLHTFCINFKLSEELTTLPPNNNMNSDLEMISEALDHVVRVLSERNDLFNKESSKRIVPSNLHPGTLTNVVKFLIIETGSKKVFYRRKCMKLAQILAPRVAETRSLTEFFRSCSFSDDQVRAICEGAVDGCGIRNRPDITYLSVARNEPPERILCNWLEYLLGSLQCYTWLLRENVIRNDRQFFDGTNILRVVAYYLEHICWITTPDILARLNLIPSNRLPSTEIADNIDVLKCLISMHIVDFLTELLRSGCALEIGEHFWASTSNNLSDLILQLVYEPEKLSLDFRLENVFGQLETRVSNFCKEIRENCPNHQFFIELNRKIVDALANKLASLLQQMVDMFRTRGCVMSVKSYYLEGILQILTLSDFFEIDLKSQEELVSISQRIMKKSFDGIKRISFGKSVAVTPGDSVKRFASSLMRIAFKIKDFSGEVLDFLLDSSELYTATLDSKIKHGWLYFEIYENVLYLEATQIFFERCYSNFTARSEEEQSYLLRILTGVLEYRRKSSHSFTSTLESIITVCIDSLPTLIEEFAERVEDFYFIEYLSVLTSISSSSATVINEQVSALKTWIISRLRSKQLNLEKKCRIISLIPILIGATDYENVNLMSALEDIQSQHFPLRSTEFPKNSLKETSLKFAFITLLDALVSSKSYVVLEFLFKCTAADETHLVEDVIRKKLKVFTISLDNDQQFQVLSRTFAIVSNDCYEPVIRLTIFRRFLLNIFINCSEEALMSFMEAEIKEIDSMTDANYRVGTSGRAVQQALGSRIIGYGLLENFFGTVEKKLYWSTTCPIALKLLGQPKAESALVGTFTKKAFYVRTELFPTESKETSELFRQYQCSVYCALCSLVSNTQTELRFYSKFLFEENSRKNEMIWCRLIDCSSGKNYLFPGQETEEYAKIKKRFVAIRQMDVEPSAFLKTITSSKHLQTQNVMESSLSQDVRGIDMTSFSVRPHSDALRRQEIRSAEIFSVRLESHDLNKHEIMPMLCGVINFMYKHNITPIITDKSIKRSYPWVQAIANNIGGCENHKNVRVFLAQVVDNCSDVFQQYAHVLFKPILRMLTDECAGSKLNFFITDMIALLVTWSSQKLHIPQAADEVALIQDLLIFVMKNAWSEKREILKFNLEIVQTILNVWNDIVKVPSNLILDMITRSQRNDSNANECGIIFLGMILSNNLIPWTEQNKILFISAILANLENDFTPIYQTAAYSLGVTLFILSNSGDQASLDNLSVEVHSRLQKLNNKKDRKSEKRFMDILYGIHKTSPHVVDSLREVICFKIPTAIGVTKRNYLEMILSRIESFGEDDIYNTIIGIGIQDLLRHYDFQLLALHILNRSLPMLKTHNITFLFDLVKESLDLQNTDCRDIAYEICIYVAKNCATDLSKEAIRLLLKGISDPDVEIQKRIYQFWSNEWDKSSKVVEQLIDLLRKYAIFGERNFLSLCTQLILDPVIESSESKKQIFEFEEDRDAKLHEYEINTKSRYRNTYTLPPLFAGSQQSRPSLFKATQLCSLVRNTNTDYVFEPTQDPRTVSQARSSFTLQSQNSMPFQIATQVLNRRSQRIAVENPTVTSPKSLRRRFLKDTEKEKRDAVLRVINVRQKNDEQTARKKSECDVGLFRRYRFGEYPDLLINNLALLLPLQALARRDLLVAKQLFVAILTAILETNEFPHTTELFQQVDEIFQGILRNSTACEATSFSAFLELSLLKPSAFNLPPEEVAKAAKLTKNLTIGALYLENRLIADWDQELSKILEPQHWLQLADIYSSLKEYEIVSAIFSDRIRTDPRLAKAIELRANGRADEAQSLLVEVIGRNIQIEHYYAYNCYYECAMELSDWSQVTQAISNEIDHPEELWTDNYNLNFLLPKLMHAKVQLLLEGDAGSMHFLETIKEWMMIPDKADYVKNKFCEELMMLWIANNDFRQCRVLYEEFLKNFLREWSVTGSLCTKTKLENILCARMVAEIDYYAEQFLCGLDEKSVGRFCKIWNSCDIDPTGSLRMWNTIVGYRKYVAALGVKTLQDVQIIEPQKELTNSIYKMTLQLFNAAEYQKNFALAEKVYERLSPNKSEANEVLSYELSKIKNILLQVHRRANGARFRKIALKSIEKFLQTPALPNHPEILMEALTLKSKIALTGLETTDPEIFDGSAEANLNPTGSSQSNHARQELLDIAFEALSCKIEEARKQSTISTKTLADSLQRLAQFSYDRLSRNDVSSDRKFELEKIFIQSLLEGMKYGSKESGQLFPCLLQLPSIENGVLQTFFKEQSAEVPVWTYLAWIPQILSRLQLSEPCYLDDIVQKIAHTYPEALRYPFAIWHKEAVQRSAQGKTTDRSVVRETMTALNQRICDKFVKCLRYLAVPESYLIAQLESFDRDIRNLSAITDDRFTFLVENLLKDVYCNEDGLQGISYRKLLRYKTDLTELTKLSFTSHEDRIRRTLTDVVRQLRRSLHSTESILRLEAICPWLSKYQWCGEEDYLELPGQYSQTTLKSDSNVMEHTKVVRFSSKLRVLVSQRYPIRMAIHGSNGRVYDYLVKHGEDLKQDQRIQQILQLMSQKLQEDKSCQSHNLFIRTYLVIPIDRNCGLLSWVNETVSLHVFIFNSFHRHCPNSHAVIDQTTKSYLEFIGRPLHATSKDSNLIVYGTAASKYTRNQLIQNLRSLENRIDYDIVKKALMDLAISPECFFSLRNNYATTLAAMNIAHWILGVGDRHLQNTLISIKDGSLTGIDFGFTFGSGTRDQKVPELTPFRLTSHMVNAMLPMGTSGLLFKCMVHTLRVFRNAGCVLLACMEVFIREPSVNWLDVARMRMNEREESILCAWEPKDRIDIARCKLQGYNPMYLFERELNVGLVSRNIEFLGGYIKILRGHMQFNIRSRLPKEKLSVEDQVNCLIDQATDAAVLGISYIGFSPWI